MTRRQAQELALDPTLPMPASPPANIQLPCLAPAPFAPLHNSTFSNNNSNHGYHTTSRIHQQGMSLSLVAPPLPVIQVVMLVMSEDTVSTPPFHTASTFSRRKYFT